ncbi:MAG: hypothetical protein ILP10_02550, partial [Lachnospiraceae bacterium]|nr:hypothetical protein [Lachnospiraceae bacterium]
MDIDRTIAECVSTPECTLYSEVLKLDWNYSIYLPRGYDLEENSKREYPVIYFLHGAYGNHRNFVERIHMNRMLEKFVDVIGVFVDGFNSFYIDGPGVAMESAVIKDLIPKIERMYRVK